MSDDIYRGFRITEERPPIPVRALDWMAAPVDFDVGDPVLHGATREKVVAEIDRWHEEEGNEWLAERLVSLVSPSGAPEEVE